MTHPWQWSATTALAQTRSNKVSCREIAVATLERIAAVNPSVNALTRVLGDEALFAADRADAAQQRGEPGGPMHGVTVTTKINTDQVGAPTDDGLLRFASRMPTEDSPAVARLRAAGALLIGRSNSPAMGLAQNTGNDLHGLTLNPWDRATVAGGSSGGAAVAVATGMCAIAQGNDLAGSLRWPAFCNGVLGFRPSPGLIPYYNATYRGGMVFCEQLMTVHGPIARTVDDLALALKVMSGPDWRDPVTVPLNPLDMAMPARCRVAISVGTSGLWGAIDPAVVRALRRAGRMLQAAGYEVDEVDPPLVSETLQCFDDIVTAEMADTLGPLLPKFPDGMMNASVRFMQERAMPVTLGSYMAALRQRDHLVRQWQHFMQTYPVILLPPCLSVSMPVRPAETADLNVRELYQQLPALRMAPLLGFPALAMPLHADDNCSPQERPLGVDILAGRWQDARCLQVAKVIEQHEGERPVITPRG